MNVYSFSFEYWTLVPPSSIAPNYWYLWSKCFGSSLWNWKGKITPELLQNVAQQALNNFQMKVGSPLNFQIFISFSSYNSVGATVTVIVNQCVLQGIWPHLSLWTLLIFSSCTGVSMTCANVSYSFKDLKGIFITSISQKRSQFLGIQL